MHQPPWRQRSSWWRQEQPGSKRRRCQRSETHRRRRRSREKSARKGRKRKGKQARLTSLMVEPEAARAVVCKTQEAQMRLARESTVNEARACTYGGVVEVRRGVT